MTEFTTLEKVKVGVYKHITVFARLQKSKIKGATKTESAMKLNSELVERTLGQIEAEAIPEDHPEVPKLRGLFGDHTFFLDTSGLNIVEPMEQMPRMGKLVNVATWDDADPPQLLAHLPEPTDILIELGQVH